MAYFLILILLTPLLPVMYIQGKIIKRRIPDLPEAKGPSGAINRFPTEGKNPLNILFLGESTMAGVGVENHREGFAGIFAEELAKRTERDVQWEVVAKSGYTARDVRIKLIPELPSQRMDIIIIGLGGNDTFTLNHPGRWGSHVEKLILSLQEKYGRTPLVFLNMPPIAEFPAFTALLQKTMGTLVKELGNKLYNIALNHDHVFYNAEIITLDKWAEKYGIEEYETAFFSDGVHPSQLTYQIWAREMAGFLPTQKFLKDYLQIP